MTTRRAMRGGLVLAAIILVVLVCLIEETACTLASTTTRSLPSGFRIAPGSALRGPAFQQIIPGPGWVAMLAVTGKAGSVYDAYADQAQALGFPIETSASACQTRSASEVPCAGEASRARQQFEIALRVCSTCTPPVAALVLTYVGAANGSSVATTSTIPSKSSPPSSSLIALTPAQQAQAHDALPDVGEPIGPGGTFSVVKGSQVLAAASLTQCPAGDLAAVLRVTGHPTDVYTKYQGQLRMQQSENPPRSRRKRVGALVVNQTRDDFRSITLVQQKGSRNYLMLQECLGS